ncbi:putative membrane protein YgcG [Rhizobium sp. BK529]|uniref:DUF2207 domain-containing protein n=1 Tax=unclassified Rhizobium TaxID=2613769 RepID=UPI0010428A4E|nr:MULTISPECIES: DUF2207 domain-containing protein [unclassified Rhizobium]MBB3592291.1 putative membrane protein YgcG [Rhizobium sp. BK529]TCS06710.1 putative membrane protein [Rhizobium sp. BK418]
MVRRFFGIYFVLLLVMAARPAIGAEFIASFDSAIQLEKSGAMTVAETITVNAEGDRIRRGIFRDFPLTFVDQSGRRRSVDFSVVSVKRDGRDEPWHTESISGGIRIYAGSEDVTISPGRHRYVFTYKTNRQIRYFDDHDELYWNVTGNGWIFPIRSAIATVTFPQGVTPLDVTFFTGPLGSRDRNARSSVEDGRLVVATTAPLGAQEGLTFAAKLPKGAIDPPSADQQSSWWFRDNRDYFIGFGGLILVFLYYTRSWLKVGRDPAREIVVPRWDPPSGISPALVNYIDNRGFSGGGWTALAATALDLAVRGYVRLEDLRDSIIIRRADKPLGKEKFQAGESELLKAVGGAGDTLVIDKANGEKVKSVGQTFRSSIEREHRGKYYNSNTGYIIGGVVLSAVALVALFVFGSLEPDTIALMVVPIGISVFLSIFVAGFVKALHRGSLVGKIFAVIAIAMAVFVGLSIVSTVVLALASSLMEFHETPMLFAVGGIVLFNILYFFIMGAPTPLGAKMTAGVDGLRQYLTLAEKDRMNMAGAPQMSPQHFETLLPYAVALGVEKPWSRTFETWLAAASAGAAAAAYNPGWYSGNFNSGSFSDRIGGFSSSMASTIASTIPSPPPSSSSSGFSGGGSSGGGGGGGGGGGW